MYEERLALSIMVGAASGEGMRGFGRSEGTKKESAAVVPRRSPTINLV